MRADQKQITGVNRQCDGLSPLSYVQCKAFHLNGVQTELKCKPNVKRCKRFVFVGHSPLLHHNTLKTKAITLFQADHILTRFVFPPLLCRNGRLHPDSIKTANGLSFRNRGILRLLVAHRWRSILYRRSHILFIAQTLHAFSIPSLLPGWQYRSYCCNLVDLIKLRTCLSFPLKSFPKRKTFCIKKKEKFPEF